MVTFSSIPGDGVSMATDCSPGYFAKTIVDVLFDPAAYSNEYAAFDAHVDTVHG